ncbi:MAG: hypothetical protein J5990_08035 [Bacteroidales bacterium]|nr:hypothetical protein [Bacteroidales bacterium]
MYSAKVYKIMFGAPSDIKEEYEAFINIIHGWNNLHSERSGIVLQPIHWSTHSYPSTGRNGQKIINDEVVAKSDLLICVFGSKLGTETDTHSSGTVEEIDEHLKAGKDVMIYFKKSINIDPENFDINQLTKLKTFKSEMRDKCLYSEFTDAKDFQEQLFKSIQLYINDHWLSNSIEILDSPTTNHSNSIVELSDFDFERLRAWTSVDNPQFFQVHFEGGSCIYGLGATNQYEVKTGKEKVEWDDFFERMLQYGFIDIEKYDRHGHPIYRLKKAAYDYINSF